MFSLQLSSFWNVEILSWGIHHWCLFTDKAFLDFSAADCDFKKFFFVFSDCPYLLLTTSLISCVFFCFHVFFHVLVSAVSVSLFKPCSVSVAFFEFLFITYSLSTPTSSSYLDLTVFRDLCCLFVTGFALSWPLLYFSCLVSMFIEGRKKKALFSFECLLSLFIAMGWCWAVKHLPNLDCTWIISCAWKMKAWINCPSLIVI